MSAHRHLLVAFVAFLPAALPVLAQTPEPTPEPAGNVWGYIFGDYFIKLIGDEQTWGSGQYADVEQGMHAGELRRLYLGYDYRFSPSVSSRVLLEANDATTFAGGSYGTFIKLGHLSWRHRIGDMPFTANLGLIPTPVFAHPEQTWGYRSVEKEALNQRGFGRAVDQGLSIVGAMPGSGATRYHVMVGNNSGTRPARNPYKAFYGSLSHRLPEQKLSVEVMGSYLPVGRGDGATRIGRFFFGYEPTPFRFGAEVAGVWDENPADLGLGLGDRAVRLLTSTFAAVEVPGAPLGVRVFGRYDYYDPDLNFDAAKGYTEPEAFYRQHLLIGGFDIRPHPRVHVIPNLWVNLYQARTGLDETIAPTRPRTPDVVPRLTFYFVY
ncbi:MAG: hypothetical protein ACK41D_08845 [Rubricoccaceae bacterium]